MLFLTGYFKPFFIPVKAKPTPAPAKRGTPKKTTAIKYNDKSAGQPELVFIFERIKELLLPDVKGTIEMAGVAERQLSLISKKKVKTETRIKEEMWFAGLIVQKDDVGFSVCRYTHCRK